MRRTLLLLVALQVQCGQVFGKVFERCELVRELSQPKHRIPKKELAIWVCVAKHESQYNTSAVGHLNADLSGDHGLFQISDQYWCSPPGVGLACGLNCDQLEDDDITDDVVCARRIYRAHKRSNGNGFLAWAVYGLHCSGDVTQYTQGCDTTTTTTTTTSTTEQPTTEVLVDIYSSSTTESPDDTSSTTSEPEEETDSEEKKTRKK